MRTSRTLLAAVLVVALGCRAPIQPGVSTAERALHGCWSLSEPIFRGLPIDSTFRDPPWRVVELLTASLGEYGSIRVLGVPGRRSVLANRPPYRLHGWRPIGRDSVELVWSVGPNAMEVRLAVAGDSAAGEFFYHGDILLPGQSHADLRRPAVPISAVRVPCPQVQD